MIWINIRCRQYFRNRIYQFLCSILLHYTRWSRIYSLSMWLLTYLHIWNLYRKPLVSLKSFIYFSLRNELFIYILSKSIGRIWQLSDKNSKPKLHKSLEMQKVLAYLPSFYALWREKRIKAFRENVNDKIGKVEYCGIYTLELYNRSFHIYIYWNIKVFNLIYCTVTFYLKH